MADLAQYEQHIIGHDTVIVTPYGTFPLVYADWAASGRLYRPIEQKMQDFFGPYVANTHTESNATGTAMTQAYHQARDIIKRHVGATDKHALIFAGSGMTGAVTLLQRILGWKLPETFKDSLAIPDEERPVVFVSELEHHSNHTSWLETIAEVVVIPQTSDSPFDLHALERFLEDYADRKHKVAAVTAASNVTGARLNVQAIARLMHLHDGLCFVDYTCAAPYDEIDMQSDDTSHLDAIYFSPHKFLGGPGTPGVLVLDKKLYTTTAPDKPGGGTVLWTNPWGGRHYYDDIETREDGGTPPFLGAIRTALAIRLKETIGHQEIANREAAMVSTMLQGFEEEPRIRILAPERTDRLAVFGLTVKGLHYNLVTRLLNDRYGIQSRGGCACAGTYGHKLFQIDQQHSKQITDQIDSGDLSGKPGFVRISLNPVMSDTQVRYIISALREIAEKGNEWADDYHYDPVTNEYTHRQAGDYPGLPVDKGFGF